MSDHSSSDEADHESTNEENEKETYDLNQYSLEGVRVRAKEHT